MLGIVIALDVALIISYLMQVDLLTRMAERAPFTMEEAKANDARVRVITTAHLCAFFISGVTFLRWFHRAVSKANALGNGPPESASSAVWSFFIPFVNLVAPYQIMKALWQASAPRQGAGSGWIVPLWWSVWIGNSIFGSISVLLSRSAGHDARALVTSTNVVAVVQVVNISAAVLAILVVRGLTARQESFKSEQKLADEFD